jgi:hypothetical protein
VSRTTPEQIAKNVARIVAVEGPMTGWRIHQVYTKCSGGVGVSYDEFSRSLNRAISAAERQKLIVSDNPYNQTGNKPRTFRLPSQPKVIARQLGPRTVDIVPPAEIAQYRREVSLGAAVSEEELLRRVADLLGLKQLTTDLRNAVVAAKKLRATI